MKPIETISVHLNYLIPNFIGIHTHVYHINGFSSFSMNSLISYKSWLKSIPNSSSNHSWECMQNKAEMSIHLSRYSYVILVFECICLMFAHGQKQNTFEIKWRQRSLLPVRYWHSRLVDCRTINKITEVVIINIYSSCLQQNG